jgi:Ca-activated chloride channel family protein
MTFGWPAALLLLLLVPLGVVAYLAVQRRRTRYAVRFTNLDLLANVVERTPGWRRHLPAGIYLGALAVLALAFARPHMDISVPREQGTVILVIDVSGSMNATDIEPTRLGATQEAARILVERLPGGFQLGLISFSNTVQTRALPTTDREAVLQGVDGLRANGGTAMGEALMQALSIVRPEPTELPTDASRDPTAPVPTPAAGEEAIPAVVVLLSDGASNIGIDPMIAADEANELNVPVFTVALGTDDGVVDVRDNTGRMRRIAVPPDPETLDAIAQVTGAQFFDAPSAGDLSSIYENLASKLAHEKQPREVTVAFAGVGALLVLAAGALSLLWFNRFP